MEIKNLAVIRGGTTTIKDGKVTYYPLESDGSDESEKYNNVHIRSDNSFGNGTLSFKVKIKSLLTSVMVSLTSYEGVVYRVGYNKIVEQFVIQTNESGGWKFIAKAGRLTDDDLNKDISFRIEVNGLAISLFINNILMLSLEKAIKETPIELMLSSSDELLLYNITKLSIKPKIFVVMEFSTEYNELFEEVIKPIAEQKGFECIRADQYYTGTPILADIIASIKDSTAIIAEITPNNPNVFYEIGYSHAIGKPTILLCDKKREKLPFDLSGFRTLFYENTIVGKKKIEVSLTKYLENLN